MQIFYETIELSELDDFTRKTVARMEENLDEYLILCKKDFITRGIIIAGFVWPFLFDTRDALKIIAHALDVTFLQETMPRWMAMYGYKLTVDYSKDNSYILLCLYCALHYKDMHVISTILASGLCDLSELRLPQESAWAADLIQFAQTPLVKYFIDKVFPHLDTLFKVYVKYPDLSLNERPDLCSYLADPKRVVKAFKYRYTSENSLKRLSERQTILMWACLFGHTKHVEKLLDIGLSPSFINSTDDHENSALTYAVKQGDRAIVMLLLEAKAQPTLKTLFTAADNKHHEIVAIISHRRT